MCILNLLHDRIDKPFVWSEVQTLIACQHLIVKGPVYFNAIRFHQLLAGIEITFALDALKFRQQLAEERPQLFVVVNGNERLTVTFLE